MRYVKAKLKESDNAAAYRIYISDGIKILTENTSNAFGGSALNMRLVDLLDKSHTKEDNRTESEVIDYMKDKLSIFERKEEAE